MKKTFVGFGFGAIQGGLMLYEAYQSGNFDRFVVAEVMPDVVKAVREGGGLYRVNVAYADGIKSFEIRGIEILNPTVESDRQALIEAVAGADELATALPSVKFFGQGEPGSVVDLLCAGFKARLKRGDRRRSVIYTAENHNHAAEILEAVLARLLGAEAKAIFEQVQCLNTVIGKMSGVVTDEAQIASQGLTRMTGQAGRSLLVEAFNRILITRIRWPDFARGIPVFEEKNDLLPFEEAKLYGHNATHALIGYLARLAGARYMADVRNDTALLRLAREAFLEESGRALCAKHRGVDPLFTESGYTAYADDLLVRMMNPHLQDAVDRVTRDPRRKLGWDDRLVGTLRLALTYGIDPVRYARGARAALQMLKETEKLPAQSDEALLNAVWADAKACEVDRRRIAMLIIKSGG